MKRNLKKWISLLVIISMVVTAMPLQAFAETVSQEKSVSATASADEAEGGEELHQEGRQTP
ncbi:MAG: hypothetical protein IKK48_03365 [Firmicutes bacterium]|nr:hypothetical protein [Bacillota bacterium]